MCLDMRIKLAWVGWHLTVVWLRWISFTSGLRCESAMVDSIWGCEDVVLSCWGLLHTQVARGGFGLCALRNKISTKALSVDFGGVTLIYTFPRSLSLWLLLLQELFLRLLHLWALLSFYNVSHPINHSRLLTTITWQFPRQEVNLQWSVVKAVLIVDSFLVGVFLY